MVCRDKAGATVSHILARYGHTEALRWLVETRGDKCVIVRTLRGATPLHYAATSGHLDTIRLIVQRLYVLSRASTSRIHCSLSGHVTSASSCSSLGPMLQHAACRTEVPVRCCLTCTWYGGRICLPVLQSCLCMIANQGTRVTLVIFFRRPTFSIHLRSTCPKNL